MNGKQRIGWSEPGLGIVRIQRELTVFRSDLDLAFLKFATAGQISFAMAGSIVHISCSSAAAEYPPYFLQVSDQGWMHNCKRFGQKSVSVAKVFMQHAPISNLVISINSW